MGKPGKTGIPRLVDAFGYSMKGYAAAWKFEAAFRQEVVLGAVLIPAAFWMATNYIELILLIMSVFLVWMAELANSSVEAVVDRTGAEHHELSGRAKDIGSALVFSSLVLVGVVWGIIAAHRFLNWF